MPSAAVNPAAGPLVVVGDTLLDTDVEGCAERLCPDAPVPVVDLTGKRQRPGGAGLAALLAARAGQQVVLVTALGRDRAADRLRDMLSGAVEILALPLRGETVCKTRVRAGGQTLVRVDSGDGYAGRVRSAGPIAERLRCAGAVLVADYGRGVAASPAVRRAVAEARDAAPVLWDPHPRGPEPIAGVRLVTPNESEAEWFACRTPGTTGTTACQRAVALRRRWGADAVVVTLGSRGAVLATDRIATLGMPRDAAAVPAPDSCGAGDAFCAAAAAALARGGGVQAAAQAALAAASAFVWAGGAGALHVSPDTAPAGGDVAELIAQPRRRGGRLVATGGCFDLLHPGHISLLQQARALGDALVVCVNSDVSIRGLKGPGRPINTVADRVRLLEALEVVDAVVVFDEQSPAAVLERLRPDVWVKGEDYADVPMPEAEVVRRHGGDVVLVPVVDGYSTTRLVTAIHEQATDRQRGVA